MTPTLYFLRSSENKIVQDMLPYAHPDEPNAEIYSKFYGLSSKDLGLYALVDNKIAGAIWSREVTQKAQAKAFVDEKTPILSFALLPEFRKKGVGRAMMQQFFIEAASSYERISFLSPEEKKKQEFFKELGFEVYDADANILIKKLEIKEIIRPSDGYDARRWMD